MGYTLLGRRLSVFFFPFLCSLVLVGCESPDFETSKSDNGSSLGGQRHFSRRASIDFIDPITSEPVLSRERTIDPEGFARYFQAQSLRNKENPNGRYKQTVVLPGETQPRAYSLIENDPAGELVAFSSDGNRFRSVFDSYTGLIVRFPPINSPGGNYQGSHTYIWTLPETESDQPTLLSVFGEEISVDNRTLTVSYHYSYNFDFANNAISDLEGSVTVNGIDVGPIFSGAGLSCPTSGLYKVHEVINPPAADQIVRDWSYHQRALKFEDNFPEIDTKSPDPVEITNTIVWDDGAPVSGPVGWSVSFDDNENSKTGVDTNISATWNPVERIVQKSVSPDEIEAEDRFKDVKLAVEAEAVAYPGNEGVAPVEYRITNDVTVGAQVEFAIINETIEPERPFTEGNPTATLKATAVFIDKEFPEEDVTWKVGLKDPEGNLVVENLADGTGCDIEAVWDGTVNGQAVSDPELYTFGIEAEACGGGIVIGVGLRSAQGARFQEETDGEGECLFAQSDVPVSTTFQISDIRFGGNSEVERTNNGPYLVYDYINDSAPNDVAQWQKDGDKVVPVVMKEGSTLYAKVDLQALGRVRKLQELRAKVKFENGGTESVVAEDLTQVALPMESLGSGLGASATIKFKLPNGIGRHRVTIDWEAEIQTDLFHSTTFTQTTPEEPAHMVYTVLGEQPADTPNSPDLSSKPELTYIWYNRNTLRASTPRSVPGERSPIDSATYWTSGLSDAKDVSEKLCQRLYEDGNFLVDESVLLGQPETSFYMKSALEEIKIAPSTAVALAKLYSNYLGAEAYVLKLKAGHSDFNFTNYIQMMGENNERSGTRELDYYASATVDPVPQNYGFHLSRNSPLNFSFLNISQDPPEIYNWVQHTVGSHYVLGVGSFPANASSARVIDPSWRVDGANGISGSNPDFALNQRNVAFPQQFISDFHRTFSYLQFAPRSPRTFANYKTSMPANPESEVQTVLGLEAYLKKYWYLYDSPADRALHGYNDPGFGGSVFKFSIHRSIEVNR